MPGQGWRVVARRGPVAAVGALLLTGCALLPADRPAADPTPPPGAATSAPTPVAPPPTTASPEPTADGPGLPSLSISGFPTDPPSPTPSATTARPAGGLAFTTRRLRGRAGTASWDIAVPVFSGAAAAAETNRRVRAAADDLIARVRREAREDDGVQRRLTGTGTVPTNDGRTVQVTITYVDFLAGTARPASFVTTTVVDVRRVRPVLLSQVLQNPPEALRFLGTEVTRVARRQGDEVDAEGLAPRTANFANWQSTPAGLTFVFPEYQLGGAGLRSYTVPWNRARLVLSDDGTRLLAPR